MNFTDIRFEQQIPSLDNLYLYVTKRCNLKCKHCWVSSSVASMTETCLPIENYCEFINQALELGLKFVKITGGEPFLRNDLQRLLEYLYSNNLHISVETNAMLITKSIAKFLFEIKAELWVSLDSAESYIHDDLRGVQDSHHKALIGIEKLLSQNVEVNIIMAVYKPNLSQIEQLSEMCQKLGIKSLKVNPIIPMGRAGQDIDLNHLLLTNKELLDLTHRFCNNTNTFPISIELPCSYFPLSVIKDRFCKCSFKNLLSVLADGSITLCGWGYHAANWIMGNIDKVNLKSIWERNGLLNYIRSSIPNRLEGVCQGCTFKKWCEGGCRAYALHEFNSLIAPSPHCQKLYEEGLFPKTRLIGNRNNYHYFNHKTNRNEKNRERNNL